MIAFFRKLSNTTFLLFCITTSASMAADVEWEGWSFDYAAGGRQSGMIIKNVEYNGKQIIGRASMPVMRVEYDGDACGPYADILDKSSLRPVTGSDPVEACDGEAVCRRRFTQNGERFLEVGGNWQIAEYQIYQAYYFSENGYIDSRVYSRGLQCTTDHRHHAHWMFDFDIGDAANDRILRGSRDVQEVEFNDLTANTAYWTIADTVTGDSIRLVPSNDDGSPDNFSKWDVAGRKYNRRQTGRWRLGARGEIGKRYMTPTENINGEDVVLWYVSHLPHAASEGSQIWHASGPRIETNSSQPDVASARSDVIATPSTDPQNLLLNNSFEQDIAGWMLCGQANDVAINATTQRGGKAVTVSDGGCIYQQVKAGADTQYRFTCQANHTNDSFAFVRLAFLDSDYRILDEASKIVTNASEYSTQGTALLAPANTVYATTQLYSDGVTGFDDCSLSAN